MNISRLQKILLASCALFLLQDALFAQTSASAPAASEKIEWPQWALDTRRFDVISFGLFPFAYLVTSIGYDLYRMSAHDWDSNYAPWPVKGSAAWTDSDYKNVVIGAALVSLTVAAVDLAITLGKRARRAKREEARHSIGVEIQRVPLFNDAEPAQNAEP